MSWRSCNWRRCSRLKSGRKCGWRSRCGGWPGWVALALAVAYLLTPQLQSAVLTEFHAIPLATPLILWSFWAIATRRWRQFAVATVLVALVKEEAALLAAGLGVWAMWRIVWETVGRRRTRRAPAMSVGPTLAMAAGRARSASLAWFYVATFVIVPAHAAEVYGVAESDYFQRYGALGDSPVGHCHEPVHAAWRSSGQIVTEPARLDYLRKLAMPFGFLDAAGAGGRAAVAAGAAGEPAERVSGAVLRRVPLQRAGGGLLRRGRGVWSGAAVAMGEPAYGAYVGRFPAYAGGRGDDDDGGGGAAQFAVGVASGDHGGDWCVDSWPGRSTAYVAFGRGPGGGALRRDAGDCASRAAGSLRGADCRRTRR